MREGSTAIYAPEERVCSGSDRREGVCRGFQRGGGEVEIHRRAPLETRMHFRLKSRGASVRPGNYDVTQGGHEKLEARQTAS